MPGPRTDGRVRQILRNLITNAFHYGGEQVVINVGTDQAHVFVEVRDNGCALPEDEREPVFDPYHRYHQNPGEPNTVGLGLTVARGLAELMAGTVSYRYENNQSIFTLRLPRTALEADFQEALVDARPKHEGLIPVGSVLS